MLLLKKSFLFFLLLLFVSVQQMTAPIFYLSPDSIFDFKQNPKTPDSDISTSIETVTLQAGKTQIMTVKADLTKHQIRLAVKSDLQGRLHPVDRRTETIKFVTKTGKLVSDSSTIIQQLWTDEEAINQAPGENVLAAVDNCSLFFNRGFVAYQNKRLFFPVGEDWETKAYSSLIVYKNGSVQMGNVRYRKLADDEVAVYMAGENITDKVAFCTFGQFLLDDNGDVKRSYRDVVHQFQDLRHIYRFPRITLEEIGDLPDNLISKKEIFLGTFDLLENDYALAKKAYDEPVSIALKARMTTVDETGQIQIIEKPIPHDLAKKELESVGYREAVNHSVKERGEFVFEDDNTLKVFFKLGFYPRTMVGVDKYGNLKIIGIQGKSGSKGSTIRESALLAKKNNLLQAMLLDHGGNAKIYANGNYLLPSSQNRNVTTSVLLITDKQDSVSITNGNYLITTSS